MPGGAGFPPGNCPRKFCVFSGAYSRPLILVPIHFNYFNGLLTLLASPE